MFAPTQASPSFDPTTGLVRAGWPATFSFSTKNSDGSPWLTGVYVVLLTKSDGLQTYAIFILRDDTRNAEVALHLPTATWHAYNQFGGESLYASTHGLSGGHARKVSLDRPITLGFGSGKFLFEEHEGVIWLEDMGYDVEYFASSDVGGAVNRLGGHRIYVTLAHDEYGTMATLDRLQAALDGGTSLAFFTGNTLAWQIRYEDNDRTIVGYKELAAQDPVQGRLTTTHFRDPLVNRPENGLIGVLSDGSDNVSNVTGQPGDWVVTNANHWVYAGTGLTNGGTIPGIIYYEWDGLVNNGVTPAGITVLASSVVPKMFCPGAGTKLRSMSEDRRSYSPQARYFSTNTCAHTPGRTDLEERADAGRSDGLCPMSKDDRPTSRSGEDGEDKEWDRRRVWTTRREAWSVPDCLSPGSTRLRLAVHSRPGNKCGLSGRRPVGDGVARERLTSASIGRTASRSARHVYKRSTLSTLERSASRTPLRTALTVEIFSKASN